MMRLDPNEIQRFREDGFLVFNSGLSSEDVSDLRRTLTRLHQNNVGFKEGALYDALGVDDGSEPARFPQIMHPRSFAPELISGNFYKMASGIAEQLLGPDLRFKSDISLMKPALLGDATPWHQDEAYKDPAFDYEEVSFWLALQPVDETNSCMVYLPGTHKGPVLPHGFPGGDPRIHALECIGGFDARDGVPCPLPAGGCVIHNGRILHSAGSNLSDSDRMAYVLKFDRVPTPAEQRRHFPWREQHRPARAQRELKWRRHGGLLVHLWRQRSRIRIHTLPYDLHRAVRALRRIVRSNSN